MSSISHPVWQKIAITLIVIAVVFFLLFGGHYWLGRKEREAMLGYKPSPVPVNIVTAKEEEWTPYMTSVGTLLARQQATIQTEVAGIISQVAVQPGQAVKQGDLLIQINDDVDAATLKSSIASAELAKIIRDQDRTLIKTKSISKTELDKANATYLEALASVEQNKATLAKKRITAPIDGTADITLMRVGNYLDMGGTVTTISDSSELYVDFTLPEKAYPQLYVGQRVTFTVDAYPEKSFTGYIQSIDNLINPQTRNISVRGVLDNKDNQLVPGMFAELRIYDKHPKSVVALPRTAVTGSLYGDTVYTVTSSDSGLVTKLVTVSTGTVRGDQIRITKGLQAGDRVVRDGQAKLRNNQAVTIKAQPSVSSTEPKHAAGESP